MSDADLPRDRVALLEPGLADQIAAGEVVERPASIVKELVENAVDAGATQVDVDLVAGGAELVRVRDDGGGIHPDDLLLALRRHATSKLRRADELVEIHTLGFRGEALASIAAVARITLRSRRRDDELGRQLVVSPMGASGDTFAATPRIDVLGMPRGTQIEVEHLFANVPARRKFLRAPATEVGHCVDALLRVALASPHVGFRLQHEGRLLVDLPRGTLAERASAVLSRIADGPFHAITGERDGVSIEAWVADPTRVRAARGTLHLMVRRRVIRDRTLAQIVARAVAGDDRDAGVAAVVVIEPPRGSVDVNVHPQKSEVRFASPQTVFAALREVLGEGMRTAPWQAMPTSGLSPHGPSATHAAGMGSGVPGSEGAVFSEVGAARPRLSPASILERAAAMPPAEREAGRTPAYSAHQPMGSGTSGRESTPSASGGATTYRLQTRAASPNYAQVREHWVNEGRAAPPGLSSVPGQATVAGSGSTAGATMGGLANNAATAAAETYTGSLPARDGAGDTRDTPEPATTTATRSVDEPALLTTLATRGGGPVALFECHGELLVVDLPKVRAWLVERQLRDELGGDGIAVQALLVPVVLPRAKAIVAAIAETREDFTRLGVIVEPFDDDSLVVRGVPAHLRDLVEAKEIGELVDRLLDWFELQRRGAASDDDGVRRLARVGARDASPRLARRWLRDVITRVGDDPNELSRIDGIRIWSGDELVKRR